MDVKSFRKFVLEVVEKWIPILGLSDWDISVDFTERTDYAGCAADPTYERADISFNTKLLRKEIELR